jgi:hypothetical protein
MFSRLEPGEAMSGPLPMAISTGSLAASMLAATPKPNAAEMTMMDAAAARRRKKVDIDLLSGFESVRDSAVLFDVCRSRTGLFHLNVVVTI